MTRDEAGNLLTPKEGEDHAEQATRACEAAIDLMTAAQDRTDLEAAKYWHLAAAQFATARMECLEAGGAALRGHKREQQAKGLVQCARPGCGQWRKPEEMVAHTTEFGGKGEGGKRSSTMLTCKGRCSER